MLEQDYIIAKDILNTAQEIAKCLGFAVIIKNSSCCHLHFQCKHGSQPLTSARCFLEVVLIDVTYKTNVYKLPFVNFIGIGNLDINKLQTFSIASIWISDKLENSYIWVIQQLISLIFFELFPLVFVTDNNATLTSAVKKIILKTNCLLCTWYILNNFKKNLRKHFNNDSFNEIIKTVDHLIN
ncbi:15660_t:CDS:2, partial [Cetraspora pellucida]